MSRDFWAGLTEPSGRVTLAALVLSFAVLYGLVAALDLTAEHLRRSPGDFALRTTDDYAFATARALDLAAARGPVVVVLGASGVRESLTSPEALSERVAARGVSAEVHVVGSADQTMAESAGLIGIAPPGPGLVVLSVGSVRLAPLPQHAEIPLRNPRLGLDLPETRRMAEARGLRADWRSPGAWLGPWGTFAAPRAFEVLRSRVFGPRPERLHYFDGMPGKADRAMYAAYESYLEVVPAEEIARGYRDLLATIALAEGRGYDVVTVKTPTDPSFFGPTAAARMAEIDAALAADLARDGIEQWEPLQVPASALYDWVHPSDPEWRARWTDALAQKIAERMSEGTP